VHKLLNNIKKNIKQINNIDQNIYISGVFGGVISYLLSAIFKYTDKNIVFISDSVTDAEKIAKDLDIFVKNVLFFPAWEVAFDEETAPYTEIIGARFSCLKKFISCKDRSVLVTSINAIYHKTLSKKFFNNLCLELNKNKQIFMEDLIKKLVESGYKRTSITQERGEFTVRGGIIDVFNAYENDPVRIEFFGDKIESIRSFDFITQRSIEEVSSIILFPVNEKELINNSSKQKLAYINDYFDKNTIVVYKEPLSQDAYLQKFINNITFKDIRKIYKQYKSIFLSFVKNDIKEKDLIDINFKADSTGFLKNDLDKFKELFFDLKNKKVNVYFFCSNKAERERLIEVFEKENIFKPDEIENIILGEFNQGFILFENKIAVFTYDDIFRTHKIKKPRRIIKHKDNIPLYDISDLKQGDYVVHLDHGIGIFKGLKKLEYSGVLRDYITLEYKDGDILYVAVEQIDLIQKYIGLEKGKPVLHKLGGRSWETVKIDTQKRIIDMAGELLTVQAKRKLEKGFAFSCDKEWQKEFEDTFLFEETVDQENVLVHVKKDMEAIKPMDRLICGDVGFGKTEIALRAAFKAVMDGKQVALLAPTTILAQQHYNTFKDRMAGFPVNIEMLSRFRTKKQQKLIVEALENGGMDIVIGTHRLIYGDMKFKDLGLLIIDEEQRFGVAHKEKIKKIKSMVDILTLTATPIPRTLYMSLTGIKEMSSINTPPEDRLPVHTLVTTFEESLIKKAIDRELARDGQIFFLHNRVKTIYNVADKIRKIVPYAKVAVAHGQMHEHELEEVMLNFIDKKFDILVCTSIIESGVDIPNANTIFIDNSDMFGLADLYQLRGRVGRSKHRAYAYFLVDKNKPLNRDAQERLSAINEFSSLGSGYKIAMRDLELRGAGNILGKEQHGCIVKVGFDMYCSLLRKAVKELQGEKPDAMPAFIDLKLDLSIPEEYIPDLNQRLTIYRKIAQAVNKKELKDVLNEVQDRFGKKVPVNLKLLLDLGRLKIEAGNKGIIYILRRNGSIDIVSSCGCKSINPKEEMLNKNKLIKFLRQSIEDLNRN
jgi:transcription-repair coupling factor (superfamily II helicase)